MARKSRSTGVGRGNGLGSARTQFQNGMPSGNPRGRPRKRVPLPPGSFEEAILQAIHQPVEMNDGVRKKKVPQIAAMVEVLFNQYPRSSLSDKIRLLNFIQNIAPSAQYPIPSKSHDEELRKLVDWISSQALPDV